MQLSLFESAKLEPQHCFKLRDYQEKLKADIYSHIRQGTKKILVYAPTGSGKTAVISSILNDATSRGKRSMLIVHRDFLVEQSRASMVRAGVSPDSIGIIKAGYQEQRDRSIQIAGLQSLQNRPTPENLDLIILDECHSTAFFSHYGKIKAETPNAIHLGFSASPWRLKSHDEYFGLHFQAIVRGPGIKDLINQSFLAPPRCFGYGGIVDLSKLDTTTSGDFREEQMQAAFLASRVPEKVVEKIQEFCDNRTGIIFNAGVEQSKIQVELLNNAGVPAVHLDASTSFKDRQLYFQKLAAGQIRVISSIGCLTEGFDVPSISFVVLARATKSRALYVQICGRGLRIHPGKEDCLILDFGSNVKRLGHLTREFPITLEPTPKREEQEMLKECPECGSIVSIFEVICPVCGHEFSGDKPEKNTDIFEKEFGELFDDETLKLVRYARSQRRQRFSKNQPPDRLWETFRDKFGGVTNFIHHDWLFGAIFGGEDNDFNRQRLLEYLEPFTPQNQYKEWWIKHHLELEFGNPNRRYKTGKDKTTQAKAGLNAKLQWWEILQVNPAATIEEIKANYRELARLYHPDTTAFDEQTATSSMQLLNLAWEKVKALKN